MPLRRSDKTRRGDGHSAARREFYRDRVPHRLEALIARGDMVFPFRNFSVADGDAEIDLG